MNFKDKYLKYKIKYNKLKYGGNNIDSKIWHSDTDINDDKILLMFLGGIPDKNNKEIYNHWNEIIQSSKDTSKFIVIVHPMNLIIL
jgi:hypothetical protein